MVNRGCVLTEQQQRLLEFIRGWIAQNKYPPTFEEMRAGLEWSTKSLVNYHLDALEEAGYVTREYDRPRTIRLSE
jgi:repressor LexA